MPVYDNLEVPLFLSLVHMLGRSDGQQTHHDAKQAGEQPGHFHKLHSTPKQLRGPNACKLAVGMAVNESYSLEATIFRGFIVSSVEADT